jgi:hypothetical protein
MEFDWHFQELMKFEQETSGCTWMTHQLMKRNLEFQILELLQEFDSNSFGFLSLVYLELD